MSAEQIVLKTLERSGFEVTKHSPTNALVKYRAGADFYSAIKGLKSSLQKFDVSWDPDSVVDYVSSFGVDRSKIEFAPLCEAELPCFTRRGRRTYTIGKSVVKGTTAATKRNPSSWIRPLTVDIFHKPSYVARKMVDIIRSKGLKNYRAVIVGRLFGGNMVGGFVESGKLSETVDGRKACSV